MTQFDETIVTVISTPNLDDDDRVDRDPIRTALCVCGHVKTVHGHVGCLAPGSGTKYCPCDSFVLQSDASDRVREARGYRCPQCDYCHELSGDDPPQVTHGWIIDDDGRGHADCFFEREPTYDCACGDEISIPGVMPVVRWECEAGYTVIANDEPLIETVYVCTECGDAHRHRPDAVDCCA